MFNKIIIKIVNCLPKIAKTHGSNIQKTITKIVKCTKKITQKIAEKNKKNKNMETLIPYPNTDLQH